MRNNIKFLTIIFLVISLGILFYFQNNKEIKSDKKNYIKVSPTLFENKIKKTNNFQTKKSIFVPYWSLSINNNFNNYDRVIYFGLSGKENGIDKNDQGYINLEKFIQYVP